MPIARVSPSINNKKLTSNSTQYDCLSSPSICTLRPNSSHLQRMYCFGYYYCPNTANGQNVNVTNQRHSKLKSVKSQTKKERNDKTQSSNCKTNGNVKHIDHSVQTDQTSNSLPKSSSETNKHGNCATSVSNSTTQPHHIQSHHSTPYERLIRTINEDERWHREVTLGRRIGFYRFKGELGNGNFSQVKIGLHILTKEKVAIKILDRSKLDTKTQRMLSREITSMEKLHHPNVVRLFEVIETFSKIYLVMELASGGELFQKITTHGKTDEDEGKALFAQIVAAVEHMHQHNIIHRDIKAENVFLCESKVVKVGDFGFSLEVNKKDELLNTFCGSPPYAAPELFSDESYIGPFVDLWALGVLLYFMVTATMPFKAQTVSILKKLILEGDYTLPNYLSIDCQNVIKGLLQNEPTDRLSLSQLQKCDWLKDQTFPSCLPTYKVVLPSITASTSTNPNVEEKSTSTDDKNKKDEKNHKDDKDESKEDGHQPSAAHSSSTPTLSNDEKEIVRQLQELGITEKLIKENTEKGLRSSVIGTYRIIIHRVMTTRYDNAGKRRSSSVIRNELLINGDSPNEDDSPSPHANNNNSYRADKYNNYYSQSKRSHKSTSKSIKSIKSIFTGNQCNDVCNYNYDEYCSWRTKSTANNYVNCKHRHKRSQKISKACVIL